MSENMAAKMQIEALVDQLMYYLYIHKRKYLIIFILPLTLLVILLLFKVLWLAYWVIYLILFLVVQALTALLITKNDKGKADITDASGVLILIGSLTLAIVLLGRHDVQFAYRQPESVSLIRDAGVIECGSATSVMYLGKTDDYAFIFHIRQRKAIVLKVSDIHSFVFQDESCD